MKYFRCYNDGSVSEPLTQEEAEAELLEEIKDNYRNGMNGRIEDENGCEVPVNLTAQLSASDANLLTHARLWMRWLRSDAIRSQCDRTKRWILDDMIAIGIKEIS